MENFELAQDLITFYGPRSIARRQFLLEERFYDCCALGKMEVPDKVERGTLRDQLRSVIAGEGKGGVIVEIRHGQSQLMATAVSSRGYQPPKEFLHLETDGSLTFKEFDQEISYHPGDHFLVPADRRSEEILRNLETVLERFSPDQAGNVLQLLSKPRLDLQLQSMQYQLSALSGPVGNASRRTYGALAGSLFKPQGLGWMVVIVAMATLFLLVSLRPSGDSPDNRSTTETLNPKKSQAKSSTSDAAQQTKQQFNSCLPFTIIEAPTSEKLLAQLKKCGRAVLSIPFAQAEPTSDAKPIVNEIANLMEENAMLLIQIEAYTDSTGSPEANKSLSEKRATAIMNQLRAGGIEASRLVSTGFGSQWPLFQPSTDPKNKRIELVWR